MHKRLVSSPDLRRKMLCVDCHILFHEMVFSKRLPKITKSDHNEL